MAFLCHSVFVQPLKHEEQHRQSQGVRRVCSRRRDRGLVYHRESTNTCFAHGHAHEENQEEAKNHVVDDDDDDDDDDENDDDVGSKLQASDA